VALLLAVYGVSWQVFSLHRLRRSLWPTWMLAVLLIPPVLASTRFGLAPSYAALVEAFYTYFAAVFAILGAAAATKNRGALRASFVAQCASIAKEIRGRRLR
jgi:hypothetical protein